MNEQLVVTLKHRVTGRVWSVVLQVGSHSINETVAVTMAWAENADIVSQQRAQNL